MAQFTVLEIDGELTRLAVLHAQPGHRAEFVGLLRRRIDMTLDMRLRATRKTRA